MCIPAGLVHECKAALPLLRVMRGAWRALSLATASVAYDPTCPCITVDWRGVQQSAVLAFHSAHNTSSYGIAREGEPLCGANEFRYAERKGTVPPVHCFPMEYGSGRCGAWDLGLLGCSSGQPCSLPWCYVHAETCRRSNNVIIKSGYFPEFPKLFFSYDTCAQGLSTSATRDIYMSESDGFLGFSVDHPLRVVIPALDYPMHFKRAPDGTVVTDSSSALYYDDSVPFEGSIISYLSAVMGSGHNKSNMSLSFTYASDASRNVFPHSRWTAAVWDVGLGVTDMGASDFWVTYKRSKIATFSTSFDSDAHYLWVKRPQLDQSWTTQAAKLTWPLSGTTWILIFGTTVMMSLFDVWLCRDDWRNDGFDDWAEADTRWQKCRVIFVQWCYRLGLSWFQLTSGSPNEPQRTAQLCAYIGWSFFILVVIAAYTANLAAFLTKHQVGSYHTGMQSLIDSNEVVCVAAPLLKDLAMAWPAANLIPITFSGDIAANVQAAGCAAIVWSMPVVSRLPETAAYMCEANLFAVAPVLMSPFAFPTHDFKTTSMVSSLITHHKQETGETYLTTYEKPFHMLGCDDGTLWEDIARGGFDTSYAALGRRLATAHERSHSSSVRSRARRLRGTGGGGAAGGGAVQYGIGQDGSDTVALTPINFILPVLIMVVCCVAAAVRSVYKGRFDNQMDEKDGWTHGEQIARSLTCKVTSTALQAAGASKALQATGASKALQASGASKASQASGASKASQASGIQLVGDPAAAPSAADQQTPMQSPTSPAGGHYMKNFTHRAHSSEATVPEHAIAPRHDANLPMTPGGTHLVSADRAVSSTELQGLQHAVEQMRAELQHARAAQAQSERSLERVLECVEPLSQSQVHRRRRSYIEDQGLTEARDDGARSHALERARLQSQLLSTNPVVQNPYDRWADV